LEQTIESLAITLLENPIIGPALVGAARSITGWLQYKLTGSKNGKFDQGSFARTLIKYEVAVNAVATLPMLFGISVDYKVVEGLTVLADVLGSWGHKLLGK